MGLERTRAGLLCTGWRTAARGSLETLGTSVGSLQMLIFALLVFVGGIAGVLIGVAYGGQRTVYWPDTSLLYFVVLVIIVGRAPWFARVAALGVAVLPTFYQGNFNYDLQIVFGASAILVGVGFQLKTPPAVAQILRLVGTRSAASRAEAEGPPKDLATVVEAARLAPAGRAAPRSGGRVTSAPGRAPARSRSRTSWSRSARSYSGCLVMEQRSGPDYPQRGHRVASILYISLGEVGSSTK